LSDFKGKKMLIVNVASQCGFTPQYERLEKLYQANNANLVIIGFPANDFMGQEPGTNEEIKTFCQLNYGVTFLLSQKVTVTGESKADLYRWLSEKELNGWNTKSPKWNFYKYLISESGELLNVFPSTVDPMSKEILDVL
jgi:glutathione peroxidase